ncbi:bacteriocin [Anaerosporomusa subterranea]|uniref:Type 1 encapsulin shell protein n=1 Tax=Anaerosporomusa subterranea TaxID=1794912 RepID=A0A154BR04_ANASB|nr:family 1 encapsulin nanocompartment shell protein [Anaerosporomusa subterranea]KYZ76453.1 bacteriocin [Anaerosporomusa subterranea]
MDFLDRQAAPLTTEEWSRLDEAVVSTARQILTGRRVVEVLGPLGSGVYSVPYSIFSGKSAAGIDMIGDKEDFIVEASRRDMATLPMLYKDFKVMWRDVEADRHLGLPLDVSTASVAANFVAVQEDNLIFNGSKELGHAGLMTVKGRQTVTLTDWEQPGAALADVVKATGALAQAGHYGPYSLVVSPVLFGKMVRVLPNTGMLELDQVKALVSGGVYYSNVLSGAKAVLLATGSHNVSLAIGQDMVTAYLGPANMNHVFRVLETVSLLVRRPEAICTLE